MQRSALKLALALTLVGPAVSAQQAPTDGPYKVLKTAKVGGEGGTDYIFADVVGRKLYIPRGAARADTVRGTPATLARITSASLHAGDADRHGPSPGRTRAC